MTKATRLIGFDEGTVEVMEHMQLPDGMEEVWDPCIVAKLVDTVVAAHGIEVVSADEPANPSHCLQR